LLIENSQGRYLENIFLNVTIGYFFRDPTQLRAPQLKVAPIIPNPSPKNDGPHFFLSINGLSGFLSRFSMEGDLLLSFDFS